jgi:Tfp pilus assembly protein PilO
MFWKKYKEYIVTIGIFLCGVVLVWFIIIPMHHKIQDRMNKSQEVTTDHEIRNEAAGRLSDLREQNNLVMASEHRLDRVISKGSIVDLVKVIESLAKETDNAIVIDDKTHDFSLANANKKVKINDSKQKENMVEKSLLEILPSDHRLGISIKLTGKYDNIIRFIRKLESMSYETDIIAISLAMQDRDNVKTQASAKGNLFTPSVEPPIVPETDPSAVPVVAPVIDEVKMEAVLDTVVYINED